MVSKLGDCFIDIYFSGLYFPLLFSFLFWLGFIEIWVLFFDFSDIWIDLFLSTLLAESFADTIFDDFFVIVELYLLD